jgi:hypothetical protein
MGRNVKQNFLSVGLSTGLRARQAMCDYRERDIIASSSPGQYSVQPGKKYVSVVEELASLSK